MVSVADNLVPYATLTILCAFRMYEQLLVSAKLCYRQHGCESQHVSAY
jgi:hypothetical protein